MHDPAPRRGPLTRQERWIYGLSVAALLALFVLETLIHYQPVKLSVVFFVLFWIPLLALHEAGHALAARLLGWYVGEVVVGVGRTVGEFRCGEAHVEVRLLPLEGFVRCVPRNLRLPRLKNALIYFAGPGIELLLAALILVVAGPETLLRKSAAIGVIALQSLALAATAGGVINLVPHSVQVEGGEVANDGLGIIRSFLLPEAYYAELIGQRYSELNRDWGPHDPADWWKR